MRAFLWGGKMLLPNILEFIGTNITQRKFQEAQEKLLNYLGIEVPTKTELNSEIVKLNNAITPKADKTYVDSAIGAISTDGSKQYATLALATADIANIALNKNIFVSESVNGGYWYKATAGATSLTKSPYDPVNLAKNYTNKELGILNVSEANDDSYLVGVGLSGNAAQGGVLTSEGIPSTATSFIIPCLPETEYTLIKSFNSDRFRIAEFETYPKVGDIAYMYSKDEYNSSHEIKPDGTVEFSFKTGKKTAYLVVYTSRDVVPVGLTITLKKAIKDARIIKGKNLFDPSSAYDQTGTLALVGPEGSTNTIQNTKNYDNNLDAYTSLAFVEVKPNTSYTIQKTASNRFRVGFTSSKPAVGVSVYIAKGEPNDANLTTTVTTSDTTNYLVLYLAKNGEAPSFVQVEESEVATSKETFGYKLSPLAEAMNVSFAGFVNAGIGDGVTDDTAALKTDILMNSGVISFDPNKIYLITYTLEIDVARYHRLNGNGARFVSASPDKPCFRLKGSMVSGHSASPDSNKSYARQQYGFVFDHTVIYGQTVGVGIGVEVTGCLAPTLTNNNIFFLDKGVVFKNTNRDVNLIGNRIWVNKTYGIEFHDSANIHQINIVSNIITYNTVNIIIDNADIYNIQITGNNIETASSDFLNTSGGANIIINAQTGLTEDVTIVGNTIEDHWVTNGMIILNGANTNSIASVCIDGNSFGNSNDVEIKMGGCSGVYVGGQFKHSYGATVEATGSIDGLTMNVQSKKTGTKGGLFKCANSSANLKNINISGSQLSGSARKAVDVIANQIQNFVINGNSLRDLSADQASIKIHAQSIEGLRVDMNNISENVYSKAIEITANQVIGKNSMLFNSAKKGTFEAPEQFNTQGNW